MTKIPLNKAFSHNMIIDPMLKQAKDFALPFYNSYRHGLENDAMNAGLDPKILSSIKMVLQNILLREHVVINSDRRALNDIVTKLQIQRNQEPFAKPVAEIFAKLVDLESILDEGFRLPRADHDFISHDCEAIVAQAGKSRDRAVSLATKLPA